MGERYTFTVEKTPAGFVAYLGDYDLDAPEAYGPNPVAAIIYWLEMWGDTLGGISSDYAPKGIPAPPAPSKPEEVGK